MIRHHGQLEQSKKNITRKHVNKIPQWLSGFGFHREDGSSFQNQSQRIIIKESNAVLK